MAPLILEVQKQGHHAFVCLTGQHREMIEPFMDFFELPVDHDFELMKKNQGLSHITTSILNGMQTALDKFKPDVVMVQGDTTSTFACALAAFYQKVPVAHIEAGLRTYNTQSPFPEEANRQMTSSLSSFHFPPTQRAFENLKQEKIEEHVLVTGNTSLDALRITLEKIKEKNLEIELQDKFKDIDFSKKIILLTTHRRENLGEPQERIFSAVLELEKKYQDIEFVFPVHLNPKVREKVESHLKNKSRIHLLEPLGYLDFVWLMKKSFLILSDSGGVQEEAPYLDKPVLVLRENTERVEGIEAGTAKLVGSSREKIIEEVSKLLESSLQYEKISDQSNPYGDGFAAQKIINYLIKFFDKE